MKNKKSVLLIMTCLVLATLILVGLSYAYYRTRVIGNPNEESISISSKNLQLTYSDGTENINTTGIIEPGTVITKTFTVTNDGDDSLEYGVYLEDVLNTFKRTEDITYTLTCTAGCTGVDTAREYPKGNALLVSNTIEPTKTHSYKLEVTYENLVDVDQSEDMGASLSGRINIDLPGETSELILLLADAEVGDYATLNSEPKKSYGVYDALTDGVVFTFTGVESGDHTLTVYNKNNTAKGSTALTINNGAEAGFTNGETPVITVTDTNRVVTTALDISGNKVAIATPTIDKVVDVEELTGVTVNILKTDGTGESVNGLKLYPSWDAAYNALQEYLGIQFKESATASNGGYQIYDKTRIPQELTWTFYGNVKFDKNRINYPFPVGHAERNNVYALTGGLKVVWELGNTGNTLGAKPIQNINVVGGNSTASITNSLTNNFEWAVNNTQNSMTTIKFSNIQFNMTFKIFQFDMANLIFTNCKFIKEARIQSAGTVTIKNNLFELDETFITNNPDRYAMFLFDASNVDNYTKSIIFEGNDITKAGRGINIAAEPTDVIIRNNTFNNVLSAKVGNAIQLTSAKTALIDNNTISNVAANAFYFYYTYNGKTTITNNTITNTAYLGQLGDDANKLSRVDVTSSGNNISVTNPGKGISEQGTVTTNSFSLN